MQAGNQCPLSVRFNPRAAGTRKADFLVNDSAADSPQFLYFSGAGVAVNAPAVNLSPTSLTFGNQVVNTTSAAATVTLQNTGAASLSLTSIAASGDFAQTNTCGTSVAANATCAINVTFHPTQQTTSTGTLTITDNASGSPQQVPLAGTGVAAATASPAWDYGYFTALAFGPTPVGDARTGTLTLHNLAQGTMQLISCTLSGDTGDFAVNYGCEGNTVGPGEFHDIQIGAHPQALGSRVATVTLVTNDAGSPHTARLTVTGTGAPVVSLPATLDAGNQPVSTTSGPKSVTLRNTGNVPLTISNVATSAEFSQTNDCGASVAANATCTFTVRFSPAQLGARSGTLTVTDDAGGSPHTVALSGTGTTPPPKITRLSTISVPTAGGTPVTVTGTGFQAGATVFFGGVAGRVTGTTGTSIDVVTPPHAEGTVDVLGANPDGQYSDAFLGFSFIPPTGVPPPVPKPPGPPAGPVPAPDPGARPSGPTVPGNPNPIPGTR